MVGMARRRPKKRNRLFAKRWFRDDVILTCVRWYLRYKLSYRDRSALLAELGVVVAPCTILRWVVADAETLVRRVPPYEEPVGRSWRVDETYVKVRGKWVYLYRAVDERGRTVESYLSRTRDQAAARIFFRKALKRHGQPRSITLDGWEPSHKALRLMGMRNEFHYRGANPVQIRSCPYLNNLVEMERSQMINSVSFAGHSYA